MTEDIRAAVELARRGDRKAFGQLVRHYQQRVYRTAYRMLGNHQDADDVSQEAFVRAYRGLPSFDVRSSFFTWLYRIVVNVSLNHLRGRKRRPQVRFDAEHLENLPLPEHLAKQAAADPRHNLELKRMVADIAAAMDELSETLRVTCVLVIFDGLSYGDAATILDCSEGTVAWRVHEARRKLRERLARYLSDEPRREEDSPSERARGAADAR
ncbi:MAG: RNA polymerase subunit sigma [Proteobacteria bacterium]|nr:MAG: RNA polymerase subunit sigma [Pseudomonadota bacterium]PIE19071.1 MAG: RNA polymerase subunit sigma [Pseudomonadota bacterium]